MQNNSILKSIFVVIGGCASLVGCVNPPERTSGVSPRPVQSPKDGAGEPPPVETPPGGEQRNPADSQRNGDGTPKTLPVAGATGNVVKVKYWLNKTDNNNCLTIQPVGGASISSKCVSEGATVADWVSQDVPAPASGAFKATIKIDTTDKPSAKTFSSASDNVGENGWRWRCVKTQDKISKVNVHTVCYEDGNAVNKTYESSDLFVQIVGPESVDLGGGVQCTTATDIDQVKCAPK